MFYNGAAENYNKEQPLSSSWHQMWFISSGTMISIACWQPSLSWSSLKSICFYFWLCPNIAIFPMQSYILKITDIQLTVVNLLWVIRILDQQSGQQYGTGWVPAHIMTTTEVFTSNVMLWLCCGSFAQDNNYSCYDECHDCNY